MNDQTTPSSNGDEIDLLDLLVICAEHWRWLLLAPLAAAAIAWAGAALWPKTYESSVVIAAFVERAEQPADLKKGMTVHEMASTIESHSTVVAVAKAMGLSTDANNLQRLQARIHVTKDRGNTFVTLTSRAPSPEQAQNLAQAVLNELFVRSQPSGATLQRLQTEFNQEKERLEVAGHMETALAKRIAAKGEDVPEALVLAYTELVRSTTEKRTNVTALQAQLLGVSASDVLSGPSLPHTPANLKPWVVAAIAAVASGLVVLFGVVVAYSWRSSVARPENAEKLRRIREAFGL